jgi:diaminopimelate epimerase
LTLQLTKHHGLGNDFLVALGAAAADLGPDDARALCHRVRGIGADGLLCGLPGEDGADARMVLHNADGSRAEISGNGLRCFVQALARTGLVQGPEVLVDTDAGRRRATILASPDPLTLVVAAELGTVRETAVPDGVSDLVPEALKLAAVDVGNPHLVVLTTRDDETTAEAVGPALGARFPNGANVHLVRDLGEDAIELRIWERGAGATQACGSGAAAAAAVAHGWGLVGEKVRVQMPGGTALVDVGDPVVLTGPAVHVATVRVP